MTLFPLFPKEEQVCFPDTREGPGTVVPGGKTGPGLGVGRSEVLSHLCSGQLWVDKGLSPPAVLEPSWSQGSGRDGGG